MITIRHPNGYVGKIFGEKSLSIYDKHNHIVMYTDNRDIETGAELQDLLAKAPEIFKEDEKEDTGMLYSIECIKCKKLFDCVGKPKKVERCVNFDEKKENR